MTTRWGIAATGGMAAAFAEDLGHVPDAEIAFVGSRSAASATEFGTRFGGARGGTYGDLLAAGRDGEVDAIYVATPHPQHHDLALAAVEGGTPLLVEKAFTATLAGAQEVVDAARAKQVFCMEAMWTRFQPAVAHARDLVAAGEIGDVVLVQADFCAQRDYDPQSRLFDLALGGGSVLDLGVYPISFAQHFLGRPDTVTATGTTYPNGADASAAIHLAYADGRAASLTCSLTAGSPVRALVVGTGGSIEVEPPFNHPSRVVVRRNGAEDEVVERLPTGRGYAHQAEEVQRCLAAGLTESPVMPLSDTLDVQWVLEETLDRLGITMSEARVEIQQNG
jgi:predicted dehydrogenase